MLAVFGLGSGCVAPLEAARVEVDEDIVTVVHVSWQTGEASRGRVEYGTERAYGSATSLEDTPRTEHAATLFGLQGDTAYHLRVLAEDDSGRESTGPDQSFTTGVIPE